MSRSQILGEQGTLTAKDLFLLMCHSHQVVINQIKDYLQSRLVYYLTNLHIKPRSIWLSRVCPFYSISACLCG